MGVTEIRTRAGVRVRAEIGYLREDVDALRERVGEATPRRRMLISLVLGAAALVHGFSLWAEPLGWIVLGICLLFTGFVLIDLDPPARRRRRSVRKKIT